MLEKYLGPTGLRGEKGYLKNGIQAMVNDLLGVPNNSRSVARIETIPVKPRTSPALRRKLA